MLIWQRFLRHCLLITLAMALTVGVAVFWFTQPWVDVLSPARDGSSASVANLRQDVAYLAGPLGRRHHARPETLARAAAYLKESFQAAGAQVSEQVYELEGARYVNVIARFGPAGKTPIVIGAHYDAEEGTRGADDNASGVAVLLETARWLGKAGQLSAPVELVAYTLEEPPYFRTEHMGSWQHARHLQLAGIQPRLVLVLEMLGYFSDAPASQRYPLPGMTLLYPDRGNFLAVVGNLANPGVVRRVKASLKAAGDVPIHSINAPGWLPGIDFSDHASYWAHGMPAVMLTDTSFYRNPHYHQSSDLPETLDYERMAKVATALRQVIKDAGKSELE